MGVRPRDTARRLGPRGQRTSRSRPAPTGRLRSRLSLLLPLWRSRDYLLWFTGDTLADFGSSLRAFAMPLIAYAATGSLTTAGLVGTVGAVASTVMTVPGGVGLLTVAMLMENVVQAAKAQNP